jgi:hypothetical protein
MPNDDLLTLRAPAHLVKRVSTAAESECNSVAAFVRRAVIRELYRSEREFCGPDEQAGQGQNLEVDN